MLQTNRWFIHIPTTVQKLYQTTTTMKTSTNIRSHELPVGTCFNSFLEFNEWLTRFKQYVKPTTLSIAHSKKIGVASRNPYMNSLVYSSLHYVCAKSGKFESKSCGKRNKRSKKTGCPFFFKLRIANDERRLEIDDCHWIHNHTIYSPEMVEVKHVLTKRGVEQYVGMMTNNNRNNVAGVFLSGDKFKEYNYAEEIYTEPLNIESSIKSEDTKEGIRLLTETNIDVDRKEQNFMVIKNEPLEEENISSQVSQIETNDARQPESIKQNDVVIYNSTIRESQSSLNMLYSKKSKSNEPNVPFTEGSVQNKKQLIQEEIVNGNDEDSVASETKANIVLLEEKYKEEKCVKGKLESSIEESLLITEDTKEGIRLFTETNTDVDEKEQILMKIKEEPLEEENMSSQVPQLETYQEAPPESNKKPSVSQLGTHQKVLQGEKIFPRVFQLKTTQDALEEANISLHVSQLDTPQEALEEVNINPPVSELETRQEALDEENIFPRFSQLKTPQKAINEANISTQVSQPETHQAETARFVKLSDIVIPKRTIGESQSPIRLPYSKKAKKSKVPSVPFIEESLHNKTKRILGWIYINPQEIDEILKKNYKMKKEDIKLQLPDSILEEEVDLELIWDFMEKSAIRKLNTIIRKKKQKDSFTCLECKEDVTTDSIRCDACLHWFHNHCQFITRAEAAKLDKFGVKWFCTICDN